MTNPKIRHVDQYKFFNPNYSLIWAMGVVPAEVGAHLDRGSGVSLYCKYLRLHK